MKKTVYKVVGLACLAAAVYCGWRVARSTYAPAPAKSEAFAPTETEASEQETVPVTETETATEPTETESSYQSPVDFDGLQEVNPDIYAWLRIKDTNIDFAIVQSDINDQFYLDHNSDGEYSANGAIFSEHEYNSKSFEDPVTVLYGHHMHDGAMLGRMQEYFTDADFFESTPTFTIYTPEAEYTYGIFAAVPYPGDHILYYHDFSDPQVFTGFFDEIMAERDLSASFREEYAPEPGDEVVILSTCLIGNNTNRFLVMGKKLPAETEAK